MHYGASSTHHNGITLAWRLPGLGNVGQDQLVSHADYPLHNRTHLYCPEIYPATPGIQIRLLHNALSLPATSRRMAREAVYRAQVMWARLYNVTASPNIVLVVVPPERWKTSCRIPEKGTCSATKMIESNGTLSVEKLPVWVCVYQHDDTNVTQALTLVQHFFIQKQMDCFFSTQFSSTQSVGMWYAGESQKRIIELTQTQGCPIRPSHLSYLSGARGYASLWRSPVQRCGCYRGNRPGRRPSPADEGRLVETEQRGEGKQIQTTCIKEQDITADPYTPACTNIII